MDSRLLEYYNQELLYIREMGSEFAREFPKIAGRIGLDGFECADPYVERLLEGFAFMAARVHLKLDAEFPKLTDYLLEMVYPHYLGSTPSMAIVRFEPDMGQGNLDKGYLIPRQSSLSSLLAPGEQTACQYQTAQDVTLWPLKITHAAYSSRDAVAARLPQRFQNSKAILRLGLQSPIGALQKLQLDSLPIFLCRNDARAFALYEQLLADAEGVVVTWEGPEGGRSVVLDGQIKPMGFEDSQALLPVGPQSFKGYRLLTEYFAFQQRFLFVELTGLSKALTSCTSDKVEIHIPLKRISSRLENVIDADNFALFCTPAINLFKHHADRIHLDDRQPEFHIVADRTRPMDYEVHSVSNVTGYDADNAGTQPFYPFYAVKDVDFSSGTLQPSYYIVRREQRRLSTRQRRRGPRSSYIGTEAFLSIVDANNAPFSPKLSQLHVEILCSNRDLPLSMSVGKQYTDFNLDTGAPVMSVRCLAGPTEPRPSFAALLGNRTWRLISHLSLNYLSIVDSDGNGAAPLRELLSLYESVMSSSDLRESDGISTVTSKPIVRRLSQRGPLTFGRGLEISLTCDEGRLQGSSAFLLSAVLSEFFAKHVSINSFTQTVLRTLERGEVMRWPIQVGRRQIL